MSTSSNNADEKVNSQLEFRGSDRELLVPATADDHASTPMPSSSSSSSSQPARRRSNAKLHPETDNPSSSVSAETVESYSSKHHHKPRLTPCSINPSTWSKQRVRIASCGCLSSVLVCAIRLILNPGPSAYIIHSIIILFDMVLIHTFTHTVWLSMAGEIVAILFATCFHLTNETVFELLETTLIAVLVSVHLILSRNEHWDKEEDLERDIIGLQVFIEQYPSNKERCKANVKSIVRRHSSFVSKSDHNFNEVPRNDLETNTDTHDLEAAEAVLVPPSDMTIMSSVTSNKSKVGTTKNGNNGRKSHWWNHFFDHFLDGSAGVMYTSFLGLIIDEIVNYRSSKY